MLISSIQLTIRVHYLRTSAMPCRRRATATEAGLMYVERVKGSRILQRTHHRPEETAVARVRSQTPRSADRGEGE